MQAWTTENLFSDSGALLPASTACPPQQHTTECLTPTPTPTLQELQELQTPSLGAFLAVPPAFFSALPSARSRTEAALVYEVAATAAEMDVLLESVREQLHDRRRLDEWLRGAAVAETTLLVVQQQARGVTERNLRLLLERFQSRLQKLSDLQFPLIQSIESCEASVRELEALGATEVATQRQRLAEVQTAVLERLQTLLRDETIPVASKLVTWTPQEPGKTSVCWPAASSNSEVSKRSTMDDARLSSSSGSMHSPFLTLSALDERRLMDAEDPNATLTDHHQISLQNDRDDGDERSTQGECDAVQADEAASSLLTPPELRQSSSDEINRSNTEVAGSKGVDHRSGRRESNASDHALSESVY